MLDKILANKPLTLANKVAPIISSSILSAYVLASKRISIAVGDGNSQAVIDSHKDFNSRADKSFSLGGG